MKQKNKKELNKNNQKAVLELKKQKIEEIRRAIYCLSISQKELAEKTGVSYIQINRILNGHISNPHWATINKIEDILKIF